MMDELPLRAAGVAKTFGGGIDYARLLPWHRNGAAPEPPRRVVDGAARQNWRAAESTMRRWGEELRRWCATRAAKSGPRG